MPFKRKSNFRRTSGSKRAKVATLQLAHGGSMLGRIASRGFKGPNSRFKAGYKEKKTIDTIISSAMASNSAPILLNGIAAGSDFTQRIGRRVVMKSILVRIRCAITAGTTSNSVRLLMIYDTQTNGALPLVPDVLVINGTQGSTGINNLDNRDRFKVIMDKVLALNTAGAAAAAGTNVAVVKKYMKCNLPVQFDSATGNIGDINTGSLLLLCLSDVDTASALDYTATGYIRVRFTDDY